MKDEEEIYMYICMYVCLYVCMYVYMYVCTELDKYPDRNSTWMAVRLGILCVVGSSLFFSFFLE